MTGPVNPVYKDKAYLRDFFSEKRSQLCEEPERKSALDNEIQARLIISPEYRAASAILVYMALPFEISTSMIIHAALSNNKTVALPVCTKGGGMVFRVVRDLSALRPGAFGILEPDESCPELEPDENALCVCPALCCDMQGYRLGFGGGYYDRYLKKFKGVKAALCYSDGVIPSINVNSLDVCVDIIHTDSYTRYIRQSDGQRTQ